VQVVSGDVDVEDHQLTAGDAVALTDQRSFEAHATSDAELLLFDMA
jgi:redox-sensitive bicupin YhaK (pirin superfamily)